MIIYRPGAGNNEPMQPMQPMGVETPTVKAPTKFDVKNVFPQQVSRIGGITESRRAIGQDPGTPYSQAAGTLLQNHLNRTRGGATTNYRVAQGNDGSMQGYQLHQTSQTPLYQEREVVPGSGKYEQIDEQGNTMTPEQVAETTQGFYQAKYPNQVQRQTQESYRQTLGLARGGKVGCGCGGSKLLYRR